MDRWKHALHDALQALRDEAMVMRWHACGGEQRDRMHLADHAVEGRLEAIA